MWDKTCGNIVGMGKCDGNTMEMGINSVVLPENGDRQKNWKFVLIKANTVIVVISSASCAHQFYFKFLKI